MEGARGMVDLKTQKTSYTKDSRLDEKQELELSRHQEEMLSLICMAWWPTATFQLGFIII